MKKTQPSFTCVVSKSGNARIEAPTVGVARVAALPHQFGSRLSKPGRYLVSRTDDKRRGFVVQLVFNGSSLYPATWCNTHFPYAICATFLNLLEIKPPPDGSIVWVRLTVRRLKEKEVTK